MSYEAVDVLIYILYALKYLVLVVALLIFVLGLDDLFIDCVYWSRVIIRSLTIFRRYPHADEERLYSVAEKPLAIMVPAWQEVGVVGEMARLAASSIDYENYQIFVGTYPNDPDTQADVDAVCAQFPNVHKVVCVRPGPTSKADCLNNIIDAILTFESQAGITFQGFILHDAEDVISPLELRLYNFLLPQKDMIQVPVYPYPPKWWEFTAGHYLDEFAEMHGKDVVVREALAGQVPSAGVGTCFSRRAISSLLDEGDGIAFDISSLTEDYDIGFRLKQKGMVCIFARFSVKNIENALPTTWIPGMDRRMTNCICVREHFPRSFTHAVKQKSRWITGIVFQGTRNIGWTNSLILNYFLWRDRRGFLANLLGLLVNILMVISIFMALIIAFFPNAWHFMSIIGDDLTIRILLYFNGFLLVNRIVQRAWFVTRFYGMYQGVLSIPRVVWSNIVNFCANVRAIKLVLSFGDSRRVAWDKTSHEFPVVGAARREPLGSYLVNQGWATERQVQDALTSPNRRRLGHELLLRGIIKSQQLVQALALQANLDWINFNPFNLAAETISKFPSNLALRYAVLPIAEDGNTLIVASETPISQVSLGAISRKIKRKLDCRLAPQGRVTLGLRFWYGGRHMSEENKKVMEILQAHPDNADLLEEVCQHQVMLGDLLRVHGIVSVPLMNQALIDFDPQKEALGEHLVGRGIIDRAILERVLQDQKSEQHQAYAIACEAA
ncbi:phage adsorption protein NrfB [Thalassospira sp. MA62]|nr:phage adsorption protein NrfB [Thalassospira sp. MA62]